MIKIIEKSLNEFKKERELISYKINLLEKKEFKEKTLPEMKKQIGKCFKYKNCYSCPQKESDYWWLYLKIKEIKGHGFMGTTFQKDPCKRIEIETKYYLSEFLSRGYMPISENEFIKEWNKILNELNNLFK